VTRRRRSEPTSAAIRRRKQGVNLEFTAAAIHDRGLLRVLARERVAWPLEKARHAFLEAVCQLAPAAMADLSTTACDDVSAWAVRWNLDAPWILTVARNTIRAWEAWPHGARLEWDRNHHDVGSIVRARGRLPARPAALTIREEHFYWLVRARVLRESYAKIVTTPGTGATSPQAVAKAVAKLARTLGLP
jgi:hypothetical protein